MCACQPSDYIVKFVLNCSRPEPDCAGTSRPAEGDNGRFKHREAGLVPAYAITQYLAGAPQPVAVSTVLLLGNRIY